MLNCLESSAACKANSGYLPSSDADLNLDSVKKRKLYLIKYVFK